MLDQRAKPVAFVTSRLHRQNVLCVEQTYSFLTYATGVNKSMAFVQRLRKIPTTLSLSCRDARPIICQFRWRSTTTISSTIDENAQPKLARNMVLDFDDPKQALKSKTTWEIIRALTVFRICSVELLVKHNKKVSFTSFVFRCSNAILLYTVEKLPVLVSVSI